MNYSRLVNLLLSIIDVGRFCTCVLMLCVGLAAIPNLQSAAYFILEDDFASPDIINPHCRVIMYNFEDLQGFGVDAGRYGGGEIAELDVGRFSVVAQGGVQEVEKINFLATDRLFTTDHCDILLRSGFDRTPSSLSMGDDDTHLSSGVNETVSSLAIIDGKTGFPVKMPASCGGVSPSGFVERDADGLWITPIVGPLIAWFILRLLPFAQTRLFRDKVSEKIEEKVGNERPHHVTWSEKLTGVMVSVLFWFWTVQVNGVLISPITEMQDHEDCPQILLAFYSTHFQMSLTGMCGFLFFLMPALLFFVRQNAKRMKMMYHSHRTGLQAAPVSWCWEVSLLRVAYWFDLGEKPCSAKGLCRMIIRALIPCCFYVITVAIILMKVVQIINYSFLFIVGFGLNLKLAWPELELAARLHAFRVLAFILGILDNTHFVMLYFFWYAAFKDMDQHIRDGKAAREEMERQNAEYNERKLYGIEREKAESY